MIRIMIEMFGFRKSVQRKRIFTGYFKKQITITPNLQ